MTKKSLRKRSNPQLIIHSSASVTFDLVEKNLTKSGFISK